MHFKQTLHQEIQDGGGARRERGDSKAVSRVRAARAKLDACAAHPPAASFRAGNKQSGSLLRVLLAFVVVCRLAADT